MFLRKKPLLILIAALILIGLTGAFLHHHNDAQDSINCTVCHFVRQIACFLGVLLVLLFSETPKSFLVPSFSRFTSLLASSQLKTRAPPLLLS